MKLARRWIGFVGSLGIVVSSSIGQEPGQSRNINAKTDGDGTSVVEQLESEAKSQGILESTTNRVTGESKPNPITSGQQNSSRQNSSQSGSAEMMRGIVAGTEIAETRIPKHALVIGNSAYDIGRLRNPVNDAKAVEESLKALGFVVTRLENLGQEAMETAVTSFTSDLPDDSLAMFFYAGHGVQISGHNYLIPTDARLKSANAVRYRTLELNLVLDLLGDSRSRIKIAVLDCCRDNPFERSWTPRERGKSSRGLAALQGGTRDNMIIAFSTAAGQTALDGEGNNSPFSLAFTEALSQRPKNGLLLRDLFYKTGELVRKATGQRPWMSSDLTMGNIYLTQPARVSVAWESNDPVARESTESESKMVSLGNVGPSQQALLPTPVMPLQSNVSPGESALSEPSPTLSSSPCLAVLKQARLFEQSGDTDHAINAFTTVLSMPNASASDLVAARRGRAGCYLGRGQLKDIKMALIDTQVCGDSGLLLPVKIETARLQDGTKILGNLHRGQVARVNQIKGDWVWVESVHDDKSRQGWTKLTTFLKPAPVSVAESKPTKSTPMVSTHAQSSSSQSSSSQPIQSSALGISNRNTLSNSSLGNTVVPRNSQPISMGQPVPMNQPMPGNQFTPGTYPSPSQSSYGTDSSRSFQQPTLGYGQSPSQRRPTYPTQQPAGYAPQPSSGYQPSGYQSSGYQQPRNQSAPNSYSTSPNSSREYSNQSSWNRTSQPRMSSSSSGQFNSSGSLNGYNNTELNQLKAEIGRARWAPGLTPQDRKQLNQLDRQADQQKASNWKRFLQQ